MQNGHSSLSMDGRKRMRMHLAGRPKHNIWWVYLSPHDGNLCRWPGIVHITTEMLGAHHIIGTSVCLKGMEEMRGVGFISQQQWAMSCWRTFLVMTVTLGTVASA